MAGIYTNRTFLVVEDDTITAASLSAMLTTYGAATVELAHSSDQACEILSGDDVHFDAVILDIDLDGRDCSQVIDCLKKAEIPFLLHSGRSKNFPHILQGAPVPFVAKPSTDFDMIYALEKVMGWPGATPPEKPAAA